MTTSEELWNDLSTARTNCVELLRTIVDTADLASPSLEREAERLLRIEHDIGVAIGEAVVREAKELVAKNDRAAQLDSYLANMEDDE